MNPVLVLFLAFVAMTHSFMANTNTKSSFHARSSSALRALDKSTVNKLEDISEKYGRLANVDSAEADAEREKLQAVAEKYATYKEVKTLMGKLRMMYRSEASESRKERQLKSFTELYNGQLELEEVLKEKLGLPFNAEVTHVPELEAVKATSAKVSELKSELERVTFNIPQGMSTRDERFFGAPQHKTPQLP
jgi:predicted S18 family serine protease